MHTKDLLTQIGGQAAIARECEITDSAVSQWVEKNKIPKAQQKYLRLSHPGKHWNEYDLAAENVAPATEGA